MTKIVRKVDGCGDSIAFWVDPQGDICRWSDNKGGTTVAFEVASNGGRVVSEETAEHCGTTLAALRDELTEEAPPEHWVEASQEVPPSPAPMEGRKNEE